MHGAGMVVHRWYRQVPFRLPRPAAWLLTFLFVNAAWVYFRAPDFSTANTLLLRMADLGPEAWRLAMEGVSGGLEFSGYLAAIALFTLQDHFLPGFPQMGCALPPVSGVRGLLCRGLRHHRAGSHVGEPAERIPVFSILIQNRRPQPGPTRYTY